MIYSGAKHPPEISDTPNEFLGPRVYVCVCVHMHVCEHQGKRKYIDTVGHGKRPDQNVFSPSGFVFFSEFMLITNYINLYVIILLAYFFLSRRMYSEKVFNYIYR